MDNNDLQTIRYTLMNMDKSPFCLYGIFSRIKFEIGMDGKLQVAIAKVTEEGKQLKGKIVKGAVKYDNDNQVYSTLTQNELYHINHHLNLVISGKYENPDAKDEKYKHQFSIVHFNQDNKPSNLVLEPEVKDGKVTGGLKITIIPAENKDNKATYLLSNNIAKKTYEREIFINLVKSMVSSSAYDIMMMKVFSKLVRESIRAKIEFDENKNSKDSKNNYQKKEAKEEVYETYESEDEIELVDTINDDITADDDIPF